MSKAKPVQGRTLARKPATRMVRRPTSERAKGASAPVIRFGLPEQSVTVGVEGPLKLRPASRALLERLTGAVVKRIEHVTEKTALDLLKRGTDAEMMVSSPPPPKPFPNCPPCASTRCPRRARAGWVCDSRS